MSATVQASRPENLVSWWPALAASGHSERGSTEYFDGSHPRFVRSRRVLHTRWGLGKVTRDDFQDIVTVEFESGNHDVPRNSLRRLLPVTVLARLVEASGSPVTAWAVRKANEEGSIQPDAIGHFAGHKVHYYDVARIPALIDQLSQRDPWGPGSLVTHTRYGPGQIAPYSSQAAIRNRTSAGVVEFVSGSASVSVSVQELRRLVPSHTMAKYVGVERRTFSKGAARRGIYPDYIAPHGRVREFYAEDRADEIRNRWTFSQREDKRSRGCVVLDAEGEVAKVESRDACGQAHLRYVQLRAPSQPADISSLRELVSLRELAPSEHMSRYRLNRLLNAVGITPVYQHGKTLYFDRSRTHEALQARLHRERNGVGLGSLAMRTGVSEAVLARKVRSGCIRTVAHYAAHLVDEREAQRIEQVVRATRSCSESLQSLGICRLHPRGRTGAEVVCWNIGRLLTIADTAPSDQRSILFGQVAWMCEGAGRKRLRETFDAWLQSVRDITDQRHVRRQAQVLLELVDGLTNDFYGHRIRLLLIASGVAQTCWSMEDRVRRLAKQAGCDNKRALERFRVHMDRSLTELFKREHAHVSGGEAAFAINPRIAGDDCTEGAILAALTDGKPEVGVIVRIQQQCWDAIARQWHKTMVVRFAHGERRITAYTGAADMKWSGRNESFLVLLRTSEVRALVPLIQRGRTAGVVGREPRHHWIDRKAS